MLKRGKSKRKSMEPGDLSSHSSAKKERQIGDRWYQEDLEKIEKIKKEKKGFFGLNRILTRMRSGSRLTTESTSKLPRMESLMPEGTSKRTFETIPERETTPENELPAQLPLSIKRNTHLKSFICDQPIRESPEYEEEKENEKNEEMFLVPGRKGSYNLAPRNMKSDGQDEDICQFQEPAQHRQSIRSIHFPCQRSMADTSISTSSATSRRPFEQSEWPTTPLKTKEFTTPRSGLRNSGSSSGTLHRIGGFLKRGLSSVGPKSFGPTASPAAKLGRKDSINSAKSTGSRRRRFSDVDCYNHLQPQIQSTPTSSYGAAGNIEAARKLQRFEDAVKVSELTAQQELEACLCEQSSSKFDAVIADALINGKPISEFSAWLFQYFNITSQVSGLMKSSCHQILHKAAKLNVPLQGTSRELLVTIGVVRSGGSDLAAITRNGYDSAIGAALDDGKTKLLVAPAFFPCDTPYNEELANAMIKTIYVIVNSQEKLSSITICGRNSAERSLLIRQRENVITEKREAMGHII